MFGVGRQVPELVKAQWQPADNSTQEEDCYQATCRQEEQSDGDEECLHEDAEEKEVNQYIRALLPEAS